MTTTINDELFVGNHQGELDKEIANVARLGDQAVDIHGKKIPESWGIRPVFVKRSNLGAYDAIMMRRFREIR